MGSKFRKDNKRRNYTVRTFLSRCLGFGLVFLLLVFCGATALAFWLFIRYEVEQSIEIGFMKNLSIRTETLTQIKLNEIEDIGADLSNAAHIISDMVSYPDSFADEQYSKQFSKTKMHNGPELSSHGTQQCKTDDGVNYGMFFTGTILQNGEPQSNWTDR